MSRKLSDLGVRDVINDSDSTTSYSWRHNIQSRRIPKPRPGSTIRMDPQNTHCRRTLCRNYISTFVNIYCAESGCYNPEWEAHADQNSRGAIQYRAAQSVQECLDYCGSQSNCVAADVDLTKQPPTCWPHFSKDALNDSNVFSQPGTTQYRLKTPCAAGPITGSIACQTYYILLFHNRISIK